MLYSFSEHGKPLRGVLLFFMQVWVPETLLFSLVATLFFEGGLGLGAEYPSVSCPLLCDTNMFCSCFLQVYMTFRILTSCLYP